MKKNDFKVGDVVQTESGYYVIEVELYGMAYRVAEYDFDDNLIGHYSIAKSDILRHMI